MAISRRRVAGSVAMMTAVVLGLSAPLTVSVDPAGAAGRAFKVHTWTDPTGDVHRVRWNPCQTITFAVNARLAGKSERATHKAIADVREAFRRAGKRTGLTFKYTGRTGEIPNNRASTPWSTRQKSAEIVVAWVDQGRASFRTNLLTRVGSGYASGVGGWMLRGWPNDRGRWTSAVGRGFVVLNASHNRRYESGFGAGVTRGALLLHELGHALGLGHVGRTSELMYPTILRRQHSNYKSGDEQGLAKLGRREGCIAGANEIWKQI